MNRRRSGTCLSMHAPPAPPAAGETSEGKPSSAHHPELGCPKRMIYGPCGGVRHDLACEMSPEQPCPFAHRPTVRWTGNDVEPARAALGGAMRNAGFTTGDTDGRSGSLLAIGHERPVVLTDFTVRPYDPVSVAEV